MPLPSLNSRLLPHVFVGTASFGGVTAADGVEVAVWMSGFSELVGTALVSGGSYTLLVNQYGDGSFDGRTITFKLDRLTAKQTATGPRAGPMWWTWTQTTTSRPPS